MESGDSFDLGNLISTAIDERLPIAPPASSPPLLPNNINGDLPQSAVAVEFKDGELPTEQELVQNHLRPALDRLKLSKGRSRKLPSRPTVVNAGIHVMNPWKLPGMSLKEGRREKYYLTDHHDLCFTNLIFNDNLETPDGFWKKRGWGWTFTGKNETWWHKKTFDFHARGGPLGVGVTSKTSWIMNVYSLITEDRFIEDELVLCHVFEEDSPAYDPRPRPKCFKFIAPDRSWPMHHGPDRYSDPTLTSYIADLENLLLGDPDTSTDTDKCNPRRGIPPISDDGQSKKRKKNSSDVWHYFTKIFARDRNGKVLTFAACNHCFKVLTGGSNGGTTHLARHKCSCPCKLQPVAAGRKAQGDVNVLSS